MTALGLPRLHLRSVDSTNERAKALARAGAPHGTLVTAAEQTAGRGRQRRAWTAAPGSAVLMSIVLRRLEERDAVLPLAAAVAVAAAVERVARVECAIKWPNDVWIDGRKLAGILVEGRPQEGWAVVGVGVNVRTAREEFPDELRETATSLALAAPGASVACTEVLLANLLSDLSAWLDADPHEVLTAWRARDALRGQTVGWEGGEGIAAGIDESGALLVETAQGVKALSAGEVHLGR